MILLYQKYRNEHKLISNCPRKRADSRRALARNRDIPARSATARAGHIIYTTASTILFPLISIERTPAFLFLLKLKLSI